MSQLRSDDQEPTAPDLQAITAGLERIPRFSRPPDRHRRMGSSPVQVGDAQRLWPSTSGINALSLGLALRGPGHDAMQECIKSQGTVTIDWRGLPIPAHATRPIGRRFNAAQSKHGRDLPEGNGLA